VKKNSTGIIKMIAYVGTVIVWIPIIFTLLTSAIGSMARGRFMMDYLIPAELFWLVLAGAVMLLIAAVRSGNCKRCAVWNLVIMIGALAGCQGAAVLTGLANGDARPEGWPFALVMSLLALYVVTVAAECILGVMIIRKIRKNV